MRHVTSNRRADFQLSDRYFGGLRSIADQFEYQVVRSDRSNGDVGGNRLEACRIHTA